MQMKKVLDLDTCDLNALLVCSLEEGHRFIQRLIDEYADGTSQFRRDGEALYVVEVDSQIVGIGGVSIDSYLDGGHTGRLRHIYIHPRYRRLGFGKLLVQVLLGESAKSFKQIRLSTNNPLADQMYQKLGFRRVEGVYKASHIFEAGGGTS